MMFSLCALSKMGNMDIAKSKSVLPLVVIEEIQNLHSPQESKGSIELIWSHLRLFRFISVMRQQNQIWHRLARLTVLFVWGSHKKYSVSHHCKTIPAMKTGFSLCGNTKQGKPCSGPVLGEKKFASILSLTNIFLWYQEYLNPKFQKKSSRAF